MRAGIALVAVLALAGCLCTKPDCSFAVTAPKDGAVLPPGDVAVVLRPPGCDFCSFPPKAYEVTLQNSEKARVEADSAAPSALFRRLGPGDYTATAVTIQPGGRIGATAVTHFKILAPPTPTPTPIPPTTTPTPVPVTVVPPPPPPPPPVPVRDDTSLADIFFDTNKWDIRVDQRATMDKNIEWLKAHPKAEVTIEGYCDERGVKAWNMTLIKNRANAARAYLIEHGIEGSRIKDEGVFEPTRFGAGTDKVALQKNRRAHFVVRQR